MENPEQKDTRWQLLNILLSSVIFLFFFQLLTDFIEAIYIFGLMGTEIPPELGMVALFFSPLLLLFFRKKVSPLMLKILVSLVAVVRAVEIFLPTQSRLIVSGIGLAACLLYFPSVLARPRSPESMRVFTRRARTGLSLAVLASIMLRALGSGSDLSTIGMFRLISWILAASALAVVWFFSAREQDALSQQSAPSRGRVYLFALGMAGVFVVLYFAISAPNVVARWTGVSRLPVFAVLLAAWIIGGWWRFNRKTISSRLVFGLGLLFALALVLAILPHQVSFPPTMDSGYPLPEPSISTWMVVPLYLMLALSPVLLFTFEYYLEAILAEQPSPGLLAGAFSVGAGFMLVMVLSQVFTTVYDYIPVIGPAFRDKFWLVFLIAGLASVLPLLACRSDDEFPLPSLFIRRLWLVAAFSMAVVSAAGWIFLSANPAPPTDSRDSLRIFTYNIQQGIDGFGERNIEGQIALIRSISPDIIGLQECDTARIAGGNTDVVAYFADRLNMYSYYGPSPVAGTFGIALLSRYPIENPRTYYLFSYGEQVAVIEAEIRVDGKTFTVYVTHLGNGGPIFQMSQMLELMRGQENVIAMGDFNFRPYEEQYAITVAEYRDAYVEALEKMISTLWVESELFEIEERIDHVFVSPGTQVLHSLYLPAPDSDHPGLLVEIGW
ncbi:endonuclease/exonuclease/phosphatase family protein [Chloroflexota bacterium]